MKYYNICFKKTKLHKKDRDSLDLLKSCSENFTDVIDNKKYSGSDFINDEHHHVIQLNKLKFKQNNQINRLIEAIEIQFLHGVSIAELNSRLGLKDNNATNSKFLSDEPLSNLKRIQRQSVIAVSLDKAHIIKLSNNKLFNQVSLDAYMHSGEQLKNQGSESSRFRYEFKQSKFEHKSFVQGQKCHIHKTQPSK